MLKIGLTGGIASGKSIACEFFKEYDIPVLSADSIAHQLLEENQPLRNRLLSYFGTEIEIQGKINRAAVAQLIFHDQAAKQWLEHQIHPLVRTELLTRMQQCCARYCIFEVPLLVESDFKNIVDRILVIDSPVNLQLQRLQARDNRPINFLQTMIDQQATREERLYYAHEVIGNDSSLAYLKKQVNILNNFYRRILIN